MYRNTAIAIALAAALASPVIALSLGSADAKPMINENWWPERLDLSPLRQHADLSNPMGPDFDYAAEFKSLGRSGLPQDRRTVP